MSEPLCMLGIIMIDLTITNANIRIVEIIEYYNIIMRHQNIRNIAHMPGPSIQVGIILIDLTIRNADIRIVEIIEYLKLKNETKNWNIQNIAQMPGSSVQVEDFTERFDDWQKNVRISAKQIVEY